jgi:S1-C subfamily serine protease
MANILTELSDALAQSVETAGTSVVRVEARRRIPASGIVWSADGLIVTANHVVRRDRKIKVSLPDGQVVKAEIVGRDPSSDLALLKIEADGLAGVGTAAVRTASEDLHVGHLVLALGRPGRTVQATLGIVSAYGDSWRTPMGGQIDHYLQTDVVMYPGFSGGPLVNASGRIIGLNTSALMRGVSLTIPSATIDRVVSALVKHGRVQRGYLGVSTQSVRLPKAAKEELSQKTGLLIVSVEPDSPADDGGLVLGDTIVGLEESAVRHHDDLLAHLSGDLVGTKIPMKIVRGGEVRTINVTIGERPQ